MEATFGQCPKERRFFFGSVSLGMPRARVHFPLEAKAPEGKAAAETLPSLGNAIPNPMCHKIQFCDEINITKFLTKPMRV